MSIWGRVLKALPLPGRTNIRRAYRRRWDMTLGEWVIYHQREIAFNRCTWMGVRALKNPLDAWIYQEILFEVRPDIVVEIGSANGGSTLFLAHMMDLLGHGTVVSVDTNREWYEDRGHPRIILVTGDSSDREIVRQVHSLCLGKRAMVVHDGDHHSDAVYRDMSNYASVVTPGSYFIVEDGVVDLFRAGEGIADYSDGPLKAIQRFLSEHREFVADVERERYVVTYNPMGYLKRLEVGTPSAAGRLL